MDAIDRFIEMIEKSLPEMLKTKQLVELGIYNSAQAAYQARLANKSPPYIRIPNLGVVYPKAGVVDFLRDLNARNTKRLAPQALDPSPIEQKQA